MVQPTPDFETYGARIDRAREHFDDFRTQWADYLEQRPHRLVLDVDPSTGAGTVRLVRRFHPPPDLALVLGEFLYQLRASLDNCLYSIAVLESGQNPPPNDLHLEWPIHNDPDRWAKNRYRLKHLSIPVREALHAIQPFQAELPEWNSLRLLNDLARRDRHRALHIVAMFSDKGGIRYDRKVISNVHAEPRLVVDGGVLATFTYRGSGPVTPEQFDLHVEFDAEIEGMELAPGLRSATLQRPWGSLERRLRGIYDAVNQYTAELVALAESLASER